MLTEKKFQKTLFEKLISIEERLHKIEIALNLKPKKQPEEIKPIEKGQLKRSLPLNLVNIKLYFDYMILHSKNNCSIGYKKISEEIGITQGESLRIFRKLVELKYLKKDSKATKILKTTLNLEDFE